MFKCVNCLLLVLQVFCHDLAEKSAGAEDPLDLSLQYLERKLFQHDSKTSEDFLMPPNSSHVQPYCQALVSEYSKQSSNFIKCSIDNARPFRFCEGCVYHYKKTLTIFQDILENDETLDNCKFFLLNSDRVQVISSVHDDIVGIWQNADCDECFGPITEDKNGTVHADITPDTNRFLELYNNFTNCIPNNTINNTDRNDTVCDVCRPFYRDMNTLFDDLLQSENSPHKVCMDIVDMMNYTRLTWGDDLKCTITQKQRVPVILLSCFLLLIPLAFYSSVAVYGTKKERTLMKQKRLTAPSSASLYGSYDNHHLLGNSSSSVESHPSTLGSGSQFTLSNQRNSVQLPS